MKTTLIRNIINFIFGVFLTIVLLGCTNDQGINPTTSVQFTPEESSVPQIVLTSTPSLQDLSNDGLESSIQKIYLPPAIVTKSFSLRASPNGPGRIVPVDIPSGDTIYIMARNNTKTHLRVVWHNGVGWIPVHYTNYDGEQEKINKLPIFEHEPPGCAEFQTTQFNFNSYWINESNKKQRVAVIVDLFRSKYGDFPRSYLSLTVNGVEIETSKRPIVERGKFSLKDIVLTLPDFIYPGDKLGYYLDTTSDEPLSFLATLFIVPPNCKWPDISY